MNEIDESDFNMRDFYASLNDFNQSIGLTGLIESTGIDPIFLGMVIALVITGLINRSR